MSLAQQTPPQEKSGPGSITRRNSRWAGFRHLINARMKELRREPEVVFWMFVFPLLLSFGLGIAFRNRPADATSIAIISGPDAQSVLSLIEKSPHKASIHAVIVERPQATQGLRLGKYDLVIEPVAEDKVQYN